MAVMGIGAGGCSARVTPPPTAKCDKGAAGGMTGALGAPSPTANVTTPTTPRGNAAPAAPATTAPPANSPLGSVYQILSRSSIGSQVANALVQNNARIDVVADGTFHQSFPGAVGVYAPTLDRIMIPQSSLRNPNALAITLAHEGVHWLQDHAGGTAGVARLGGALGQAITATNAVGNGAGGRAAELDKEAQSYTVEALVAQQLGIRDDGLGVDPRSGRMLPFDTIRQIVNANPAYQ